ncbi:Ig-like domain (group 2) [Oscillibacter sp. PC13]|uniref:Ig-like domain-containing protein n=1 Tax=Oscillibacter sp. PC13 TaxID=1855299 RepID=UPI0008E9ADAD|nr:Ig-like domain-containing protein [Oscillibacter sp. PC13]SFP01329.1 Ig-like domain (group 2) [Oscillibacter sp. PC13]
MSMKRCPVCGEKYSDTYKNCPFCEEEAALRQGDQIRRGGRGGKRAAAGPNLLSPMLVVLILLMGCLLVYLLFGDQIAEKLGLGQSRNTLQTEDVTPSDNNNTDDGSGSDDSNDGTMPSDGDVEVPDNSGETNQPDDTQNVDLTSLPETLTMNYLGSPRTEFTMAVGDDPIPLTASGGNGNYVWSSSDEGVASVSDDGKVTAISVGRATLTVQDGTGKGVCTVLVKAGADGRTMAAGTETSGSGGEHKLNREDMTLAVGEKFQLKLSGITTALSWTSADSGVAAVSSDGTVTGIAPGKTTITVSWDGASKSCIVYVKR